MSSSLPKPTFLGSPVLTAASEQTKCFLTRISCEENMITYVPFSTEQKWRHCTGHVHGPTQFWYAFRKPLHVYKLFFILNFSNLKPIKPKIFREYPFWPTHYFFIFCYWDLQKCFENVTSITYMHCLGLKINPVFRATWPYLSEPANPRLILRKFCFFRWGLYKWGFNA